jgi:cysteine desulfurase
MRVYLDNHATTPVDRRVLEAMLPFFTEKFGNASSHQHRFGWEAETAVENARKQVAKLINARAEEIIFTSGATESDNLGIKGAAYKNRARGKHILTLPTEHRAVLDAFNHLSGEGFEVTVLAVRNDGLVSLDDLKAALTEQTVLVSIQAANNEIGVLQPLAQIGKLCRQRGIVFHTDAAQAVGKVPLDVQAMQLDMLSISAHKFYGPKGVGALYVRRTGGRVELTALLAGGGQEQGLRPGTLNVPGIVGLGKACELARLGMAEESQRLRRLRDRLKDGLLAKLSEVYVNGDMEHRLPHNLNLSFAGVDREALLTALDGIALSTGSACSSGSSRPSYVLKALGVRDDRALSAVRFGLGRFNTVEEIDYVIGRVTAAVTQLRELSCSTKGDGGPVARAS